MRRFARPFLVLFLLVGLTACPSVPPGYEELRQELSAQSPEAAARFNLFETAAKIEKVQIGFESAVLNPAIPSSLKAAIKIADREMVTALREYTDLVIQCPKDEAGNCVDLDLVSIRLNVLQGALLRAQALIPTIVTLGLVEAAAFR